MGGQPFGFRRPSYLYTLSKHFASNSMYEYIHDYPKNRNYINAKNEKRSLGFAFSIKNSPRLRFHAVMGWAIEELSFLCLTYFLVDL